MSTKKLKKLLAETNAPVAPKALPPPTLREMIRKVFVGQSAAEQVLSVLCNKMESVGTESARIFNRFESFESRREQELKKQVERLEQENQFIRDANKQIIQSNFFLRGRLATLEQVANVKPLDTTPGDPTPNIVSIRSRNPFDPYPR